jgi:hypothetical protein
MLLEKNNECQFMSLFEQTLLLDSVDDFRRSILQVLQETSGSSFDGRKQSTCMRRLLRLRGQRSLRCLMAFRGCSWPSWALGRSRRPLRNFTLLWHWMVSLILIPLQPNKIWQ